MHIYFKGEIKDSSLRFFSTLFYYAQNQKSLPLAWAFRQRQALTFP